MIPVKICGITNLKDAQIAESCGASSLGFIFHDKSPRYILPETACQIVEDLKGEVSFVGVFVDETLDNVNAIIDKVGLNIIQLHGVETPEYCQRVKLPVIKVFQIAPDFNAEIMNGYDVHAFLFDTYKKGKSGGTGEVFNWQIINGLQTAAPIILSGGLGIDNITNGIDTVSPSAVDINSGVEKMPGVKDGKKMKALFSILENTESIVNPFDIPAFQGSRS